jgi:hypothetical protein
LSARASINCAVIRTRLPARTTEPSTTASTLSSLAISGVGGRCAPLNCITEPREITRSALTVARSVVRSSVIPSAKYSWFGSPEKLSSGEDRDRADGVLRGALGLRRSRGKRSGSQKHYGEHRSCCDARDRDEHGPVLATNPRKTQKPNFDRQPDLRWAGRGEKK